MVLPSIPLPDTLKGVDDLIRTGFEDFRGLWFTRLLASTALVVVGLLFEAPEIWHESVEAIRSLCHSCRPKRDIPAWMKLVGTLGWALIVVGVAGEFVADSFVSKADGFVQKFDEILLADAQRKTGAASERAAKAFERAAQTEREASQENERAARAEQQASTENARAAKALEAAEIARKNAEGFQLQIAHANERAASANETAERERVARLQLEVRLADRTLTPAQQNMLVADLGPFSGTAIDVATFGDSSEVSGITQLIVGCLRRAGWTVHFAAAMPGQGTVKGILVGARADSDLATSRAAALLVSSLQKENLSTGPWAFEQMTWPSAFMGEGGMKPVAPIRMFIGSKP